MLANLCENHIASQNLKNVWKCHKENHGRIIARCVKACLPDISNGTGKRFKILGRTQCEACVTTVPLKKSQCDFVLNNLESLKIEIQYISNIQDVVICQIRRLNMSHSGHVVPALMSNKRVINRISDLLSDENIRKHIVSFMDISDRRDGFVLRLHNLLSESFPNVEISYNILRNSVRKLMNDEKDAHKLVTFMEQWKLDGSLHHLSYGFTANNTLSYI